mmetsp:Transcript_10252/g.31329  ORF Transcript_10252/g.31329 Transcript_10252/m.31329 type:complete len:123 (-) Transcript_10252:1035-1403(-)
MTYSHANERCYCVAEVANENCRHKPALPSCVQHHDIRSASDRAGASIVRTAPLTMAMADAVAGPPMLAFDARNASSTRRFKSFTDKRTIATWTAYIIQQKNSSGRYPAADRTVPPPAPAEAK